MPPPPPRIHVLMAMIATSPLPPTHVNGDHKATTTMRGQAYKGTLAFLFFIHVIHIYWLYHQHMSTMTTKPQWQQEGRHTKVHLHFYFLFVLYTDSIISDRFSTWCGKGVFKEKTSLPHQHIHICQAQKHLVGVFVCLAPFLFKHENTHTDVFMLLMQRGGDFLFVVMDFSVFDTTRRDTSLLCSFLCNSFFLFWYLFN